MGRYAEFGIGAADAGDWIEAPRGDEGYEHRRVGSARDLEGK